MNTQQQLENVNKEPINQPEIEKIIRNYKLVFFCPHCDKEINDNHFSEGQKSFQYLNEHIRSIIEKQFALKEYDYRLRWINQITENRKYETLFPEFQKLKELSTKQVADIARLNSSEHIEGLERVKKLNSENIELRQQVQNLLLAQNRPIKRKGELFEQYISEELHRIFDDKDKISKLTQLGKKADFLQEVLTETEPKKIVGKIVYETKDTEKWENEWVNKLENDMAKLKADFGIIIATCENGKSVRCLDPRKRIYVSDDTNFIYIAKIMRDSLVQKHNLLETISSDKDKKLKDLEEWIDNKLPQYLSRLEKELDDLNKNTNNISRAAESIKNLEVNIRKIILEEVKTELSNF